MTPFHNDLAKFGKRFTMTRELQGFDYKPMRNVLASHIRELNYRGSTNFWFKKGYSSVTIYSPHWINQLRINRFVWWICVILQLWIITWPVIWLMEKRYEVARSQWNSSLDPGSETGLIKCYAQGRDEDTAGRVLGRGCQAGCMDSKTGRRCSADKERC